MNDLEICLILGDLNALLVITSCHDVDTCSSFVFREFDSIKPNVGRVFKIWEERRTYEPKFVKELRSILDGGKCMLLFVQIKT